MSFETESKSIMALFREPEGIKYKIPKYQRAYSWTEEEVFAFCNDLNQLYINGTGDYFFGAIITIGDDNDKNTQEVIDGQQRMTTFTILISQLYNLCEEVLQNMEDMDKQIKIKYKNKIKDLRNKQGDLGQCLKNDDSYKLSLSKTDEKYFNKLLNISAEKELIDICNIIVEEIESKDSIKTNKDALNLYTKKFKKDICKISEVPVDITYKDFVDAYINKFPMNGIYNKKNIIKNLLIKYINDRLKYKDINDYLNKDNIDDRDQDKLIEFLNFSSENTTVVSHKNLKVSFDIISDEIIKPIVDITSVDDRLEKLTKFIEVFIRKTYVVNIYASNKDNAYTMFQVLNDRGRALGIIELLRPYTLQLVEGNGGYQDKMAKWWDILSEDNDCENYMKYYLSSYMHVSSREKKIHNKYKEQFFNENDEKSVIYSNVEKIYTMKHIYQKIKTGEWPYENSKTDIYTQNRLYQIIKSLEYKGTIPLLLSIFETGTESDFINSIDTIERIVFRYITICEKKPSKLINIYDETIKDTRKNKKFSVINFRNRMNELLKEDGCDLDEFKEKIIHSNKLKYNKNNNKIIKYFLSTLEYYYADYINNESKVKLDEPSKSILLNDNVLWIEHIYPQSPKNDILEMEPIKHSIGNLTLIQDEINRKASNDDFAIKKLGYKREKIEMTKMLQELDKWEKIEFTSRLDLYKNMAAKIFTIDGN